LVLGASGTGKSSLVQADISSCARGGEDARRGLCWRPTAFARREHSYAGVIGWRLRASATRLQHGDSTVTRRFTGALRRRVIGLATRLIGCSLSFAQQ
jgi:hypothetical protein